MHLCASRELKCNQPIKNKDYEFTIEVNISDITEEKMKLFKEAGVNRLSVGIQTINDKFFSFLNIAYCVILFGYHVVHDHLFDQAEELETF